MNQEVLSGPNPLMVVNGKVTLNAPPVRHAVQPTVVEANHVVSAQRARAGK